MMQDLKSLVNHVNNPLLEVMKDAHLNCALWYKLRSERQKFVDTMRRHRLFWGTSMRAYLLSLIVSLFKLYDDTSHNKKQNITHNFHRLIEFARNDENFSDSEILAINSKYQKAIGIAKKVTKLRHNYFAHLNPQLDEKSLFRLAQISPDELKELVVLSFDMFNLIRYHFGEGELGLLSLDEEVDSLFQNLTRGRGPESA